MQWVFNKRIFYFLILVVTVVKSSQELLNEDGVEDLLYKFATNTLTERERRSLLDVGDLLQQSEYMTMRSAPTRSETRFSMDCFLCRSAFNTFTRLAKLGANEQTLTSVVSSFCVTFGIESAAVCRGAIALNIPILVYIARNTEDANPRLFCSLLMQNQHDRDACRYDDPRLEWQVELPPVSDVLQAEIEIKPLKIGLVTDAHIDPLYEAFGAADCDEPTCCRIGQKPSNSNTYRYNIPEEILKESLVRNEEELYLNLTVASKVRESRKVSKVKVERNSSPAGYWGDYRDCDTPLWAFDDVIETMAKDKDIDMVYYIGDSIDHFVWETTYELINDVNRYVIEKMRKEFGDNVLVLPTIGNHESQPTNQFAPSYISGDKLNTTWLYDALADKWSFYLPEDTIQSVKERGDFSLLARPGLRVISINNNVGYKYNWWIVYDPQDAKKHLDYLVQELHKAELNGEKVHIITHIPPGVSDLTQTWTREYNRIVNRFSSTIAAEFNGHTHSDEFKIFYSESDEPINVAWGVGSATSYANYNLNYKVATIDPETFKPLNIESFVYNLTEANLHPNRRPHWFKLYDFKTRFNVEDLSPQSLNGLVHRMVSEEKHLLDIYAAYYSKLSDVRWPNCDEGCKLNIMCNAVITVLWDRRKCNEMRDLYFSRQKV